VETLDSFAKTQLLGYAYCSLPVSPGSHQIDTYLWRPCGTPQEDLYEFYLGAVPHLLNNGLVHNPAKAKEERCRLFTKSAGKVHLSLDIILRHFESHKIQTKTQ